MISPLCTHAMNRDVNGAQRLLIRDVSDGLTDGAGGVMTIIVMITTKTVTVFCVSGGSMRDKGGRRRFRPGWMTNEAEEGVDNPAFNLEPVVSATFSIGDPEEAEPNVAITVTDFDKQDTSMV